MSREFLSGLALVLAAGMIGMIGTAHAQDAEMGEETPAAEEATADVEDESVSSEDEDRAATAAEKELERDLAKFWGSRRQVKVVQRRLFAKDGRFEVAPFAGIIPNDDFIVYYPTGLRASYHFSEAFTIEASFAHAIESESELGSFLESVRVGLKLAAISEYIRNYYNVNLLWAPFYGKISLLGLKLTHFETYVGMGFGFFSTTEKPEPAVSNDKSKPSGNTILGFRWFINDMFNVRTEYRQFFYQKVNGGVSIPVELSLGFGVTI